MVLPKRLNSNLVLCLVTHPMFWANKNKLEKGASINAFGQNFNLVYIHNIIILVLADCRVVSPNGIIFKALREWFIKKIPLWKNFKWHWPLGVKVWDVKENIKKGLIKWPMEDSTCISPTRWICKCISHVLWNNIYWLKLLNVRMTNGMANERFLMHKCISSYDEKTLIGELKK